MLCVHCKEKIKQPEKNLSIEIKAKKLYACCLGCKVIAEHIYDSKLQNYYRYTQQKPNKPNQETFSNYKKYQEPSDINRFITTENNKHQITIVINNMHCAACLWLIENKIKQIKGVIDIQANLTNNRVQITWNAHTKIETIIKEINKIGFNCKPFIRTDTEKKLEQDCKAILLKTGVSILCTMQIMMLSFALYTQNQNPSDLLEQKNIQYITFILSIPLIFFCAQPFYKNAFNALKNLSLTMDVHISMAIIVTFITSSWATITKTSNVYFESAAMLISFLLINKYLQIKFKHKANMLAHNTNIYTKDIGIKKTSDQMQEIKLHEFNKNDILYVKAGEVIGLDGVILKGKSSVQEDVLTGESMAVPKAEHDTVYAGSTNIDQDLLIKVTHTFNNSLINKITAKQDLIINNKSKIINQTTKIAKFFIIFTLMLAITAWCYWSYAQNPQALTIAISILIASCPCALALAIPLCLNFATAILQQQGIIFNNIKIFEKIYKAKFIIFDKTGTLTNKNQTVTSTKIIATEINKEEIKQILKALTQSSNHPVAKAVSQYCKEHQALKCKNYKYHIGKGITATINNDHYQLGSSLWTQTKYDRYNLFLLKNNKLICCLYISDTIYNNTKHEIDAIKKLNFAIRIASGDNHNNVTKTADALGIKQYKAEALPDDKLKYIQDLQQQGQVIAVGDGANDSLLLAQADISIAISSGVESLKNKADIIFITQGINQISNLIKVAKLTAKIIKQNLAICLIYNTCILSLACCGLLPPYLAALGMSISSAVVCLNSTRITRGIKN